MRTTPFFAVAAAACLVFFPGSAAAVTPAEVINTYTIIAAAMYGDAHSSARALGAAVDAFLAKPSTDNLGKAREAWLAARVPYQQTEGYRFGNEAVDDWEGKVNAWPLDEGLIDYVDGKSYGEKSEENPLYSANVIASETVQVGSEKVSVTVIDKAVLEKLHEAQEVEANVARGYHAIEFLLWGQDLNGTGKGAGNRPATDFDEANCTNNHCDRRRAYLKAATDLLIDDLAEMTASWQDGPARKALINKGDNGALTAMLTGLGSLSYGELAGERIKLGLMLHDPEEEHDCFSDNTHNSHYYDEVGMQAIWTGRYQRSDGTEVKGPSLADLAAEKTPEAKTKLDQAFATTLAKMQAMKDTADSGKMAYDQMLADGNPEGNKILQDVVDALVAQTRAIEAVVAGLGLKIEVEGSDSLDNPSAVQ